MSTLAIVVLLVALAHDGFAVYRAMRFGDDVDEARGGRR